MERYEKKKYLRGYQNAIINLKRLEEEYETVYTEATKIVPTLTGMPSSNVKDDKMAKYAAKLAEIQARIDNARNKIARIDAELAHLKPYHRTIIELVDVKGYPVSAVARKLNITEHGVRVKRNRIIDKMFLQ